MDQSADSICLDYSADTVSFKVNPPSEILDNQTATGPACPQDQGYSQTTLTNQPAHLIYSQQQYPGYPQQLQPPYVIQQPYLSPQYQQYYSPQQQSSAVFVNAAGQLQASYVQPKPYQSFSAHMVLACFVTWSCGLVFGIVALILAVIANDRVRAGQETEARHLGRASLGVSIAGIVVGLVIAAIIIGVVLYNPKSYRYY